MADDRPNILLIVSEDHSPDLGCYGDPNARTPFIDRLAEEGVRFGRHHTPQAICSPGRASILTGLHPHQNGQIALTTHNYAMYRRFTSLPAVLHGSGYRTGRIGKLHVAPEEAFPFDFAWNDHAHISFQHRDVATAAGQAGAFAANGDAPFFLYACFSDAHLPLLHESFGEPANPRGADEIELPEWGPFDAPHYRDRVAGYYNCLERLDRSIEEMVAAVCDASDRDLVILFTTDHGRQFPRGKCTCYEPGLRVPLILHAPDRFGGGRVSEQLTSHVDVMPTLLEIAGLEGPADRPGASLTGLVSGDADGWRTHVVGQWNGSPSLWFPQRSITDGRHKLIENYLPERPNPGARAYLPPGPWETSLNEEDLAAVPDDFRAALERSVRPSRYELYDLETDPHELVDLAGEDATATVEEGLLAELRAWQERYDDRIADPDVLAKMTDECDELCRRHYPKGVGFRANTRDMELRYHEWLDPGVPA